MKLSGLRKLKVVISILMAVVMLAGSLAVMPSAVMAVTAVDTLTAGSVSGAAGATVTVPVTLTSTGEVAGVQFTLNYDSTLLTYVKTTRGTLTTNADDPFSLYVNGATAGTVNVIIYYDGIALIPSGTGTVANIQFTVAAGALGGQTSALSLSAVTLSDASGAALPKSLNDGQFNVPAILVTGVSLNKHTDTLTAGGTEQLIATIAPANATNQNVTWSSDNSAVATVSASGLVTAVAAGPANISVTTVDGSFSDVCALTVLPGLSSNANLSGLTISSGALDPVFTSETTSYTANVSGGVTSVSVTPTAADAGATIQVNGIAVSSGSTSGAINLTPGANTISVVVTAENTVTTKTYTIAIASPPVANFSADITSGVAPLTVAFTDLSTNSPTSWAWDFNNNGTVDSTDQNPEYTYLTPGTYTVKLTTTNANGSDDEIKMAYITVLVKTWYISNSGSDVTGDGSITNPFATIQKGINTAGIGETVIVKDGNYPEILTIGKALTLRSEHLHGATLNPTTLPTAPQYGKIITISASNVIIDGLNFTQLANNYGNYGIYTSGVNCNNCTFTNNNMVNIPTGIYLGNTGVQSDGHIITNNTFSWESYGTCGIWLYNSRNSIISNNTISHCAGNGIYLRQQGGTFCDHNTISGNTVSGSGNGIYLKDVSSNTISNNTFSGDSYGVYFESQNFNVTSNVFYLNSFIGSTSANLYLWARTSYTSSTGNVGNIWNSQNPVSYWYNGTQYTGLVGNYWGSYFAGTDTNPVDGISETAYTTRTTPDEFDIYPLMFPVSSYVQAPVSPVADFTCNSQSGYAPLPVNFTNLSTGSAPLSYAWDFDNNGSVDSTVQNPSYIYNVAGTYSVKLTVTNTSGSNAKTSIAYISVKAATAAFTCSGQFGHAPYNVTFTDQSTGSGLIYAWDFKNDGTATSAAQNPSYAYDTPGTYAVKLTVTNTYGSDVLVKTSYITVKAAGPWIVEASGSGDFTTIQAAVNAALAGETIVVKNGIYPENVAVGKALVIKSENIYGATVNPASGNIFTVTASGVTIDGFSIISPISASGQYGIYLNGAYSNCTFKNNTISNIKYGVDAYNSATNNIISNNTISLSSATTTAGIYLQTNSSSNTISTNSVTLGTGTSYGIYIQGSGSNTVSDNVITGSTATSSYGFYLTGSAAVSNTICRNQVTATKNGLRFASSAINNTFYENSFTGITTLIYSGSVTGNIWNSPSQISYWYNGAQFTGYMGNYWGSAYSGTDTSPLDGIGDSAFTVNGVDQDIYPLMGPFAGYFNTHTLAATAGTGGSISPSGSVTVQDSYNQSFTITPDPGYSLAEVKVDDVSIGAVTDYTFSNVTANHTIAATFTQNEYILTINKVGNGTVTADKAAPYHYGDVVTLSAVADSGWNFTGFNPGASVTMDDNKTVTATFTQGQQGGGGQTEYTLTINKVGNGTVTADKAAPYYAGVVVTLSAVADAGWTFTGFDPGATVTMNGNKTVTATFTQNEYTLTINKVGNGTVTSDKAAPYHYGDVVTLSAVADAGWTLAGFNPGAIVTMNDNQAVTVTFTQNQYTLTINKVGSGSVTADKASPYHYGDVVTLSAVADAGWTLAGFNPGAIVTMNDNQSVIVTFTQNQYTLTILVSPQGAGIVNVDKPAPYHYGDIVALTPQANSGYTFSAFSSNVTGSSITMVDDITVTATFVASIPVTYTITAGAAANGSIDPSGDITVDYNSSRTFKIVPADSYHIANVLVDGSPVGPLNSYTFNNVAASHTISATFADGTPWYLGHDTVLGAGGTLNGQLILAGGTSMVWESQEVAPESGYAINGTLTLVLGVNSNWSAGCAAQAGYGSVFQSFNPGPVYGTYENGFITIILPVNGTIPAGHHLAVLITNTDGTQHEIWTDGSSFLLLPSGSVNFPLPELSAAILLVLGLLGLVGFVMYRRKKVAGT